MSVGHNLPISEAIGVFIGVTGFDWLIKGQAEPFKAVVASITVGALIVAARHVLKNRHKG